ncbi:hypothetical protein AWB93_11060 [Mycobacterium bohemicum]|uniref:Uncharacterized protein n=2 Tax=Mycobacterium bohemicum TaxID=56425 RepID=A0A1X1R556_MYCBE|nr:hypothetical protein [Mycobacterium bohemicum]ORU99408.1 hypothetical protein AWB93_11060 [Mycobacterium bohemicum]
MRREPRQAVATPTMYSVTDRLHRDRTVRVTGAQIAPTVAAWLAELGVRSPLVDDLARAACVGDWASAYAVCDQLSVDVALVAAAGA